MDRTVLGRLGGCSMRVGFLLSALYYGRQHWRSGLTRPVHSFVENIPFREVLNLVVLWPRTVCRFFLSEKSDYPIQNLTSCY